MQYTKPSLTFEQQADLLLERGLIADRDELISRLKSVNYYRLSGYLFPFRNQDNTFYKGITLEKVWKQYTFDRQFRLLVMDGIERIEILIRTKLCYHFSHSHGPFGYVERENLPKLDDERFNKLINRLIFEQSQSKKEIFVKHFREKYSDCHQYLPLWIAVEIANFGTLFTLYKGSDPSIKKIIANDYDLTDWVLLSWLSAINSVRNICAHHGRLWNRQLGDKPKIPKERKHPQWHEPVKIENNRVFAILTIIKYMLNIIAPQSNWQNRLNDLLDKYSDIPIELMGFPENWKDSPIWKGVI